MLITMDDIDFNHRADRKEHEMIMIMSWNELTRYTGRVIAY